jgi:hypothetical protein
MKVRVPDNLVDDVKKYVAKSCRETGCGEFVEGGATYLISYNEEEIVNLRLKFSGKEWPF